MLGFIQWVIQFVLRGLGLGGGTPQPTQEAVQAKQAGGDEVALATEEKANAEVQSAVQAEVASDQRAAADHDSLRAPDQFSRD